MEKGKEEAMKDGIHGGMNDGMVDLVPDIGWKKHYRMNNSRHDQADAAFRAVRREIVLRDRFVCQGCGVSFSTCPSPGSCLDVHHRNANHRDNRPENLISLCRLCHGIFHIGFFARELGRGMRLLYCPEILQKDLNLLSWTMAVALEQEKTTKEERHIRRQVKMFLGRFDERTRFPDSYFKNKADVLYLNYENRKKNIAFFASLLGQLRKRVPLRYTRRKAWLGGLRIWYDPRKKEVFKDRAGNNLALLLAQSASWQCGSGWAKSWCAIEEQFGNRVS